ncbi:MAG: Fe/S biosis protein NfuA [Thermoleophilaceae bacterium]|nr:Fe/S biosis protein NfuA [Thermoleophilaceae bacterium]
MPLVTVTDKAREKVEGFRDGVADSETQAMWIEVAGIQGGEFTYSMSLKPLAQAGPDDHVQDESGLAIVIPARDGDALRDATIDWSDDLMRGGLTIDNPNTPSPSMGAPVADLSGEVPQRVMQVLDQQVNPSIAMLGGSAELVAVEESTAYVRLGGGCVGCGMATVTLSQGIEVAITDAVPEIDQVVDVTDHASGTNPYYEAAKK